MMGLIRTELHFLHVPDFSVILLFFDLSVNLVCWHSGAGTAMVIVSVEVQLLRGIDGVSIVDLLLLLVFSFSRRKLHLFVEDYLPKGIFH